MKIRPIIFLVINIGLISGLIIGTLGAESYFPKHLPRGVTLQIWTDGPAEYVVAKDSETFTLDEFIKSGKFCEIYGHMMTLYEVQWGLGIRCGFCKKDRDDILIETWRNRR